MFTYNEEDDCFILNLDKERLKDAPGFEKDHWPNFTSTDVSTSIEQFYIKHKEVK